MLAAVIVRSPSFPFFVKWQTGAELPDGGRGAGREVDGGNDGARG
jgi:hypothetical protein